MGKSSIHCRLDGMTESVRIWGRAVLIGALALSFAACNSGSSSSDKDRAPVVVDPPATYAIGGTISGLSAEGLVLQNNDGDDLTVAANADAFEFATEVTAGGAYRVAVLTQPEGLTCTVGHGNGTNISADVNDVAIVCSADTYTIAGTVAGLATSGLVLQNNGADDLAVAANATSLQFATPVAHDGGYHVTVLTQPLGLFCTVAHATGVHVAANVVDVEVSCSATTFPIAGTVSGLSVTGLLLQNNGGDDLMVPMNATGFEFATPVAFGGGYSVTVLNQPAGLICTVNNGSGSSVAVAVSDVDILCSVDTFDIGGSISGLIDSGLVLRNNGADDLSVTSGSTSFQFPTAVAYGGNYNATVQQQPTSQTCVVTNGSGTNVVANITNIGLTCSTNTYTVGGSVSGLTGTVTLQNNGGDNLAINADGAFTFATPVADGGTYNTTVLTQPSLQTCVVSNGSGTMGGSNVTNVDVSCSASTPSITGVTPSSGSSSGGTLVTITGSNFTGVTDITFGGIPAAGSTVLNDTTLEAFAPAHSIGAVDITVTNPAGSATATNGFIYGP